jgi:outer membrane receptor protein involved in Fe transport
MRGVSLIRQTACYARTGSSPRAWLLPVPDTGSYFFRSKPFVAYRSPYLTAVPGANLNDVEGTKQTINVDFASSWNVTENFQLTLEALNLTNQFQYQYVDSAGNRMNYYHQQGRDYLVGARYKF